MSSFQRVPAVWTIRLTSEAGRGHLIVNSLKKGASKAAFAAVTPSRGRPEDTLSVTNPVEWIYTTGAAALTSPSVGVDIAYVVSNDTVLHSMNSAEGDWPPGWRPFQRMDAPAQGRPNIVPLPLAGANKVIFPGSQDGHV